MLESWEPAAVQSQLPDELSYPPLLLFLLHIWPKWGKMASGAAVHTQPFMKCPTGALELKWEVSREKWKCFDIFMFFPLFQRSWKEPFFVISINVAFVFALLSSWGTIFLRWCSVLIRLRWAGLGAAVEGFIALRMAQPCLEFEKLSQSVTASRCACISYLMKLKRTPVSGRLVKKKQLTHNWYNDL